MARIPFPTLETMTPDQRRVYDAVVSGPRGEIKGPLLAALHRPELADKWQQLGELLRFRTSLRPRHSELAILVTARCNNCPFEWLAHEGPGLQAGLDPADLSSICAQKQPAFADSEDAAIYDFAMQLQTSRTVGDGAYQKVLDIYGVVGVVELTAVIGYYTMVAMTLNTHQFPLPANVAAPF